MFAQIGREGSFESEGSIAIVLLSGLARTSIVSLSIFCTIWHHHGHHLLYFLQFIALLHGSKDKIMFQLCVWLCLLEASLRSDCSIVYNLRFLVLKTRSQAEKWYT